MARRLFQWLAFGFAAASAVAPAAAAEPTAAAGPTAAQVAERIQAFYEATKDFQAAFRQVYTSQALGKQSVSTGFLYIKKPGLMRWDYQTPRPKHFVVDGKAGWMYDPELEQVMVQRSFEGSELSTAVTFLWGKGKLSDEFEVAFSRRTDLGSPQHYLLQMTPKKKARFTSVLFVVERDSFRVVETVVEDPGGNINHLFFSKMASNTGLKDESFRFEIPEGVEVIEAPRGAAAPSPEGEK